MIYVVENMAKLLHKSSLSCSRTFNDMAFALNSLLKPDKKQCAINSGDNLL
jgi:hypothetical protein